MTSAKQYASEEGGQDERPGMSNFMAIEVIRGGHVFRPRILVPPRRAKKQPRTTYRYNAGHELESLFWIAIYTLYSWRMYEKNGTITQARERMRSRLKHREAFSDQWTRDRLFATEGHLIERLYADFANELDVMRDAADLLYEQEIGLKEAYSAFETKLVETGGNGINVDFLPLHTTFEDALVDMSHFSADKPFVRTGVR